MKPEHPDELAEKYSSLLHGLLAPIRHAHETPSRIEIDSAGIADVAWQDLVAEFPEVKRDDSAFSPQALIAGLDGVLGRESTAESYLEPADLINILGSWLQLVFENLRTIDPQAIEVAGLKAEGFDHRAVSEGLDIGLRLVNRIVRDIENSSTRVEGSESEGPNRGDRVVLTSLVRHLKSKREPEPAPYAAWSAARLKLRADGERGKLPALNGLHNYLDAIPAEQQSEALQDLVATHLQRSWSAGSGEKLEAYVEANPSLGNVADLPADLIEDEMLARYQYPNGDFPAIGNYRERFPSRPEVIDLLTSRCLDAGRYLKLRRIGVGSIAVVWEAFDRSACRQVAIKEPLTAHDQLTASQKRHPFAAEVALTARLEHPGIVSMVEVVPRDDTPPFFVMRLVGRLTLSDKIQKQHTKLAKVSKPNAFEEGLRDILETIARICDAIDYAHKRGILHCDLKPENIACNHHGDIGVIDWGLAVAIAEPGTGNGVSSDRSSQRRLAGTPHYMAPEQMDGVIDVRSEVFGLGAILYETLTAQPPYHWSESGVEKRPENWPEIVRQARFPRPRKIQRRIPKPLEAICRKAMASEPEHRQQSAAELARDLRTHLSGTKTNPWY